MTSMAGLLQLNLAWLLHLLRAAVPPTCAALHHVESRHRGTHAFWLPNRLILARQVLVHQLVHWRARVQDWRGD